MGQKFLIDTNVLIDLQSNTLPENGIEFISKTLDHSFSISFISYIEFLGYSDITVDAQMFISLAEVIEINKTIIDQTILIRKAKRSNLRMR